MPALTNASDLTRFILSEKHYASADTEARIEALAGLIWQELLRVQSPNEVLGHAAFAINLAYRVSLKLLSEVCADDAHTHRALAQLFAETATSEEPSDSDLRGAKLRTILAGVLAHASESALLAPEAMSLLQQALKPPATTTSFSGEASATRH
jgi:hypothetical protein